VIRIATLSDLSVIQDLNHDLFINDNKFYNDLELQWPSTPAGESYFNKCLTDADNYVVYVYEKDQQIAGYLCGRICQKHAAYKGLRAEIDNMYVTEACRSAGIGSQLIQSFKNWAREKNVNILVVTSFAANTKAAAFYSKNGFEPYSLTQWQKIS